jgi:hypothetical protein
MIRITQIEIIPHYNVICEFNSGVKKKLAVLPIIERHKHLSGVENLLNEDVFKNARIGQFGEIVWEKIVKTEHDGQLFYWDYDISPEFAFQNSTPD